MLQSGNVIRSRVQSLDSRNKSVSIADRFAVCSETAFSPGFLGCRSGNSYSRDASVAPCDFQRSACLFPPGNAHSRGFQPLLVVPDVLPAFIRHWRRQASVPLAAAVSGPRLGVLGDEIPQRFYIAKRSKIRQSGSETNPDGRRSNSPVFLRVVLQLVFSERIWKAKKATIMQKTHPLRRLRLSCILQTAIHSAYRMKGRFA